MGDENDFDLNHLGGVFFVSETEGELPKLWRVWLLDIGFDDPQEGSCIRYLWDRNSNGARISIEHINNDLARSERKKLSRTSVITRLKNLICGLEIIAVEEAKSRLLGRPEGTGWFKNVKEFRMALRENLATQVTRPTELDLLKLLDDHPLCQLNPQKARTQSHTKLLRDWLHKAKLRDYDEALRRYWKPSKKRK